MQHTYNTVPAITVIALVKNPEFDPLGPYFLHSSPHLTLTMERLFSPCTRLHDLLVENQDNDHEDDDGLDHYLLLNIAENVKELNLDVSTEEFLSAERAFTYTDLYAMLGNGETVAWLTPHAAVALEGERVHQSWLRLGEPYRFTLNADGIEIVACAISPEHLLELCDVVLRLLAASVVHSVTLGNALNSYDDADTLIIALTLAHLMEHCQSLKCLSLMNLEMDENHCRVLGGYSRPGLEIVLISCKLNSAATSALVEVLGRNQGPTKLHFCDIDSFVLADGLRGNSLLKSLRQAFSGDYNVGTRKVLAIADAVRENRGLVVLNLRCTFGVNDETWGAICDSFKTHPTLEVFNLHSSAYVTRDLDVITPKVQTLVDMMKVNTSLHTIHVQSCYSQHELYRESVIPYLETNRFRPRLLAIQKTNPIEYRTKVLGEALLATRMDANSFWMMLSGNAEVAFPPRTTTITAAANLTTPAASAAPFTANIATAAASTTGSLPPVLWL
jgi:hypothetical protein